MVSSLSRSRVLFWQTGHNNHFSNFMLTSKKKRQIFTVQLYYFFLLFFHHLYIALTIGSKTQTTMTVSYTHLRAHETVLGTCMRFCD